MFLAIPIIPFIPIAVKLRRVSIVPIFPFAKTMWSGANKLVEGFLTVKEPFAEEQTFRSIGETEEP